MRKQPYRPSLSHGRGPRGPRSTSTSRRQVEEAATPATPAVPVEQAARLAMPAVAPAEQHTAHLSGLPKHHPPPPSGASRQACHAGGRADRAIHPTCPGLPTAIRRQDWRRGPQDCALHLNMPPPSGASRQACHADGRGLRLSHPPWCAVPMGNSLKKARPGRAQQGRAEEGRTPSGAKINGIGYEPVPRCCA